MSFQYELVHWFHRVGLHDANQKCYWFQTSSNSLMEMGLRVFLLSLSVASVSRRFRRFHKLWRLLRIARILIKNSHFQSQYRRKHTFQAQPIAGFSFIETHNAENSLFVRIRMRQSQNKLYHLWELLEFQCLSNIAFQWCDERPYFVRPIVILLSTCGTDCIIPRIAPEAGTEWTRLPKWMPMRSLERQQIFESVDEAGDIVHITLGSYIEVNEPRMSQQFFLERQVR